jgi:hypothetical protein
MQVDASTWFESLPESDQEHIRDEAIEYFAELLETGSVTMRLNDGQYVLSLTVVKEG